MMSLWDALRMNMMISYQELVRTFPNKLEKIKLLFSKNNFRLENYEAFSLIASLNALGDMPL
ncbi:Uncharacterised protein [Klebsiella quasipneumoniae]|nr:Uncharacterised protein [Klebsiella quasipneumoniae]